MVDFADGFEVDEDIVEAYCKPYDYEDIGQHGEGYQVLEISYLDEKNYCRGQG